MKSGFKIIGGIAACCIGVGIVFGVIGFVLSRKETLADRKNLETIQEQISKEVNNIQIEIDYGQVKIVEGNDFNIHAEDIHSDRFQNIVENGTWYIKENSGQENITNLFGFDISSDHLFTGGDAPEITITVPKDVHLGELTIDLGAGEINVNHIIANKAHLYVGAGKLEIDDFHAEYADITCGAGQVKASGRVETQLNAECGFGQIELDLNGEEDEYNYNISCGLGHIGLNNDSYNFSTDRKITNTETQKEITLDCGVGEIDVEIN